MVQSLVTLLRIRRLARINDLRRIGRIYKRNSTKISTDNRLKPSSPSILLDQSHHQFVDTQNSSPPPSQSYHHHHVHQHSSMTNERINLYQLEQKLHNDVADCLRDIEFHCGQKKYQKLGLLMTVSVSFAGFMFGAYIAEYGAWLLDNLGLFVYTGDDDDNDSESHR